MRRKEAAGDEGQIHQLSKGQDRGMNPSQILTFLGLVLRAVPVILAFFPAERTRRSYEMRLWALVYSLRV